METPELDVFEARLQALGLTNPHVTPERLRGVVADVEFIRPSSAPTLTLCVLTLENGFNVVGESACADPANFNEGIGKELAYKNALNHVWPLEGYLLKQKLYEEFA